MAVTTLHHGATRSLFHDMMTLQTVDNDYDQETWL